MANRKNFLQGGKSEVQWNDDVMALVKSFSAELSVSTTTEKVCGDVMEHDVPHTMSGKGTLRVYRTVGSVVKDYTKSAMKGDFPDLVLTECIKSDSGTQERVQLGGVVLTTLSLADFEVGTSQEMDIPFSFDSVTYLD